MATKATATTIVKDMLAEYGLTYSSSTVNRWVGLLTDDPNNMSLIQEEIRQSPEFAERFPGLSSRIDNGYNQISVAEYLELEDAYATIMRTTGMPQGYYDSPEDFASFIANDIDPTELESRVAQGYIAAQQAPDEVKAALRQFYGIQNSDAALAAYYLDPDKALTAIQREFEAAQIGGAATATSFEGLSQQQAEDLQRLGVTEDEARRGFSELASQGELLTSNLGQDTTFTIEEQLDAAFRQDAEVRERIRRQREQRLAEFGGRVAPSITNAGLTALGGDERN